MTGLLDYIEKFYANDGIAGLLGMKSAQTQIEENDAKVKALAEEGQGPMYSREQMAALAENPMVFALGTSNVGAGTVSKALPMDEASRMARATEQGFVKDVYHGGPGGIEKFTPSKKGLIGKGVYVADNGKRASQFAPDDGGVVYPLKIRGKIAPMSVLNAERDRLSSIGVKFDDVTEIAKKNLAEKGFVGVGDGSHVTVIFDPKNIRSRFAVFDPAKKDSSDLLAGIGLLGLVGASAAPDEGM